MISPVVVKLTLNNLEKTGNVVGKIYAFSTLGSILGTFATGFFLISWMGTRHILLTMGIILILSALIFGGFFSRKKTLASFSSSLSFRSPTPCRIVWLCGDRPGGIILSRLSHRID